MPEFAYRAIDPAGKAVKGTLEAPDRRGAVRALRARAVSPVEVAPVKGKRGQRGRGKPDAAEMGLQRELSQDTGYEAAAPPAKAKHPSFLQKMTGPSGKKLALPFLIKLHQLHKSGMPLGDAVSLMSNRLQSPALKQLANDLWHDLSEGHNLATSMRRRPEVFEPTLSFLVEAGEATGHLAPILADIIENMEQRAELKKLIIRGLSYPVIIICMTIIVGLFSVNFLIPRIQEMISKMGSELTIWTQLLVGFSDFLVSWGPFLAGGAFLGSIAFAYCRRTQKGRTLSDGWFLRIPLLSRIIHSSEICRCSNVMAVLMQNGVNTTETLRLAENTVQNTPLRARFHQTRIMINDGAPFSTAFRRFHFFTDTDNDILSVGENTGSLVESFREIFRNHTDELQAQFKLLTALIGSGAMLTAVSMVALIAFGIVTSILNVASAISSR